MYIRDQTNYRFIIIPLTDLGQVHRPCKILFNGLFPGRG
jgi:hypothetical protein